MALPYIAAFVYLVILGRGITNRSALRSEDSQETLDTYIRATAIASPSAEMARAKTLFDSGAVNENEFNALKTKVLST